MALRAVAAGAAITLQTIPEATPIADPNLAHANPIVSDAGNASDLQCQIDNLLLERAALESDFEMALERLDGLKPLQQQSEGNSLN